MIGGVLVVAVSPGRLQLGAAVATAEESHPNGLRPTRHQQIRDAVADDDRRLDTDSESLGSSQEEVRVRFGVAFLIAGHDRHSLGHVERL